VKRREEKRRDEKRDEKKAVGKEPRGLQLCAVARDFVVDGGVCLLLLWCPGQDG